MYICISTHKHISCIYRLHCASYVDFVAILRLVGLNNSHWFLMKVRNLKWKCRHDWVLGVHTLCEEREKRLFLICFHNQTNSIGVLHSCCLLYLQTPPSPNTSRHYCSHYVNINEAGMFHPAFCKYVCIHAWIYIQYYTWDHTDKKKNLLAGLFVYRDPCAG